MLKDLVDCCPTSRQEKERFVINRGCELFSIEGEMEKACVGTGEDIVVVKVKYFIVPLEMRTLQMPKRTY